MAESNMLDQNQTGKKEEAEKLVKYKVKNTCWWNERLWRSDSVAEIPDNLTPPKEHFVKI